MTPAADPWIETPAGGLFFVNALLVAPLGTTLVPLALGAILRGVGLVHGPSPVLDTIPTVAAWAAPRIGWLAAPAAWLTIRNLRMVERPGPRRWLLLFLAGHVFVLGWTVAAWLGG